MPRLLTLLLIVLGSLPAHALELTVWEEEQPDIQKVLDELSARYAAATPGMKIKRSHFNTEDLRTQFQMAGMAKTGADLVLAPNDFAGVFSVMGIIQPVEGWARMERFTEPSVKAITDAKGHAWGVPLNLGNHLMLFVNKALVPDPPKTLAELVARAKAATKPAERRFGIAWNMLEPFWFVPFMGAWGERPLVDAKPNLDNPATVAALQYYKDLKFTHKVVPEDCNYACAESLFVDRKAAMTINGDWAIGKFQDALGKDLAILPLPRGDSGQPMQPMVSGKYLMFRKSLSGERLAAAKAFAEFVVSKETQAFLVARSKRLSSLKAGAAFNAGDPVLEASAAAQAHAQPMPMVAEMRAVWDAIRPQLQELMAGRTEPKAAAAAMQKEAEKRIKEMAH